MERLAREEPVEFIRECLVRYRRNVSGLRYTMYKEERIAGHLEPPEVMHVEFREQPFSVFLRWDSGARKAAKVLYVEGEQDGKLLVMPTPRWYLAARVAGRVKDGLVVEDAEGEDARHAGRFTIKQFGLYNGLARLLSDWEAAQKKGALHVEYLGEQAVERMGNRPCYVLRRTRFLAPERDGVTEQTVWIDKESWLQVGSLAAGPQGVIGAYYYRDVEVNPEFAPNQFTRAGLK
jgi:hypothetical protein